MVSQFAIKEFFLVEFGGGLQRERQELVRGAVLHVILYLLQERRHEVECLVDIGKIGQERGHVVVILDPVHPDPGKDVRARDIILIIGLVHVPDEGYVQRLVGHRQ